MITNRALILPAFATAVAVAVAGCASTPATNPQVSRIETELRTAYGDRYTAEYGHADLANAESSLAAAQSAMRNGHDGETQHDLTMAEGYIALGGIHGGQERAKAETQALRDQQEQARLTARDRDVEQANDRTVAANTAAQNANNRSDISRAEAAAAQTEAQAADGKMATMRSQLSMYDIKISELGATLVLRDVTFDTDSTALRAGAVNRLAPLIAYLQSSPATTVRIEGHTDSTGSVEHNNELSLGRADAVRQALLASGTLSNVISTYGEGQIEPIASNDTVSGREQNRRVEVTLQ
jgi:outer membrane protein OmpA-like peptidoglycan-associated protein